MILRLGGPSVCLPQLRISDQRTDQEDVHIRVLQVGARTLMMTMPTISLTLVLLTLRIPEHRSRGPLAHLKFQMLILLDLDLWSGSNRETKMRVWQLLAIKEVMKKRRKKTRILIARTIVRNMARSMTRDMARKKMRKERGMPMQPPFPMTMKKTMLTLFPMIPEQRPWS